MKIIIIWILSFVSFSSWFSVNSIIDFIKMQKSNIKEKFFKLEPNYMMFKLKNISKLYNHNNKYICKRNFSVVLPEKNSDLYDIHNEHYTLICIYKDKFLGYFYISSNLTTNCSYKKIAEVGILHESKSVHIYNKCDIRKLDTKKDVKNLKNHLKDLNVKQIYTEKIRNNLVISKDLQNNLKFELENKYGCKNLIDLTENMTNKKDLNIILIDITKDLENNKID